MVRCSEEFDSFCEQLFFLFPSSNIPRLTYRTTVLRELHYKINSYEKIKRGTVQFFSSTASPNSALNRKLVRVFARHFSETISILQVTSLHV